MNRLTGFAAVIIAIFFFMVPKTYAEEFGGVGLRFFIVTTSNIDGSNERHMYYVDSTIPGTPAGDSDIGLGGQITEINGKEVDSKNPDSVRDAIRGPVGTEVKIKVFRQKWDTSEQIPMVHLDYKEYTFTRAVIKAPDLEK
ncbi:hypothetical protein A2930_03665 [Candidatus Giovannonibacteria bacterium RIFCSPLOWO2_01_FULL_45_34]|uniref:PDZ domain-containing protein n=1 Tax=Candidatus Giovannonibacteria bacterium RIFCSPLOWO2_01_FULL_45_34 TaxID=1798351 RepID=A0A1F5WYQ8_9BACT|nr:MAG: hypothetical protein A3C73_04815 [Candidatus Giovannonibacteria bacterium RIFCSPHIGHO2_02_FULL_44_11]OGF80733.1 MAG: hypothetical protein A2930_03665 [Candidatus Giovannonibacteria bacterium RIFCSPLOWO2_01_FULL_45_34]